MSVNGFTFDDGVTFEKYNYNSLDNIPDIENGTYPNMAVGSLIGENKVVDKDPYFSRPSASIGDREFDTLVGGTLGWNQLIPALVSDNWITESGVTASFSDDVATVSSTIERNGIGTNAYTFIDTHKYFISFDCKGDAGTVTAISASGITGFGRNHTIATSNTWEKVSYVVNSATAASARIFLFARGSAYSNLQFKNANLIDLTTLFGSTIADYIYSLETAHAGDGVAWVRKYLPETYYAYCAPTLKHVTGVSAHVMRDANNNVIGNYPIDSTWVGMGIPKLDSDGKLYFDGDRYASDGTVTVKYREITVTADMVGGVGTATTGIKWAYVLISDHPGLDNENARCPKYLVYPNAAPSTSGWIRVTHASIYVFDNALTDLETAKSLLTGLKIVYQLETPTTSSATPFVSPQICDKDGTEEYVTTGLVPVGHETFYPENPVYKLNAIPSLPTTAGSYRLKVTVSGGVPSYEWTTS